MFLIGAGASVEAGVPATFDMTERLAAEIGAARFRRGAQALNFVCGALLAYDGARGESPYKGLDVERVFAAVELLGERTELEVTPFVASWHPAVDAWDRRSAGMSFDNNLAQALVQGRGSAERIIRDLVTSMTGSGTGQVYRNLAAEMIDRLRAIVAPQYENLSYLMPLVRLGNASGGLTVATLNYDLTVELACEQAHVAADTGIEHWIEHRRWRWAQGGVRLLKLHGSIDWCWKELANERGDMPMLTVVQSVEPESERRAPALVFGARNKLKPNGPFLSLLSEFEDRLRESGHLIVVGYSFRDDHINEIIRRWTREDKGHTITLIDPRAEEATHERGFRGRLIQQLNPRQIGQQEPLPQRVAVRAETAGEAFAQLTRE
jgi:hypothetical protein